MVQPDQFACAGWQTAKGGVYTRPRIEIPPVESGSNGLTLLTGSIKSKQQSPNNNSFIKILRSES
jgi:hypothetical protein